MVYHMAMEILLGEIVETSCNNLVIMVLYKSCKDRCPGFGHSAQSLAAGKGLPVWNMYKAYI